MAKKKPYIVTAGNPDRCVIFGWTEGDPKKGDVVKLTKARMVLSWPSVCGGLFGLAADGPKQGTKLTAAVTTTTEVVRTIAIPAKTAKLFDTWGNS